MEPLEHSEQLESLLAGYVLGNLTPEETAQMKQLLESNPALLTDLHQLQTTLALLPLSLPITSLSEQLETRILQAAEAESSAVLNPLTKPQSPVKLHFWKWGGAIAAVIIAGLGIATYQLHQKLVITQLENQRLHQQLTTAQAMLDRLRRTELATTRQQLSRYQKALNLLRQPNNRFLTLRGTSPKLQSSGSLVMVPTKGAAMLVLQDVAPLPKGKVYRLWAFENGQKISCGDFLPNNRGEVFLELPLDKWGGTTEVVVTIEPDRALPMPVGEMVITGS
ncbi:MAG: anti-sigma factor [Goleter apudmare HA4340-LM2]|jgi:anti-sigma-K factor RskA|nr:anti-sigma factor [Goleter apudmare HA4340-LM2]